MLDSFKLDGKVAMVTGGGRGLGRTMEVALAQAGEGGKSAAASTHKRSAA